MDRARTNSFLHMRDRSKSMEGGVLHQTTPHLLHEHSALSSKFRPPPDYNVFDWLVGKLNKLNKARKRQKNRENRNWIKMKKKFQKVVESRCGVRCKGSESMSMGLRIVRHSELSLIWTTEMRPPLYCGLATSDCLYNIIHRRIISGVDLYYKGTI